MLDVDVDTPKPNIRDGNGQKDTKIEKRVADVRILMMAIVMRVIKPRKKINTSTIPYVWLAIETNSNLEHRLPLLFLARGAGEPVF